MARWRACALEAPARAEEDLRIAAEHMPRMLQALAAGVGRRSAATIAGIKGRRWARIEELANGPEGVLQAEALELVEAADMAIATTEETLVLQVREREPGWQAAAWVLERAYPQRWSTRVRDVAQEQVGELIEQLRVRVGEELLDEAYAATSDAGAAGRKARA